MNESKEKGKKIFLGVTALVIISNIVSILMSYAYDQVSVGSIISLIFTVILYKCCYDGRKWAKILISICCVCCAVNGVVILFQIVMITDMLGDNGFLAILFTLLTIFINMFTMSMLLASESVKMFFEFQQEKLYQVED